MMMMKGKSARKITFIRFWKDNKDQEEIFQNIYIYQVLKG